MACEVSALIGVIQIGLLINAAIIGGIAGIKLYMNNHNKNIGYKNGQKIQN